MNSAQEISQPMRSACDPHCPSHAVGIAIRKATAMPCSCSCSSKSNHNYKSNLFSKNLRPTVTLTPRLRAAGGRDAATASGRAVGG